ncbi:hypothetical protein ACFLTE_07465 [Bacteroidota bacterium]
MHKISKNISIWLFPIVGLIILFHLLIPHHHHYGFEKHHQECENNTTEDHNEHDDFLVYNNEDEGNHHKEVCHFETNVIDKLKKHSYNYQFTYSTNNFIVINSKIQKIDIQYYQNYSFEYQFYSPSRAPPVFA